MGRKLKDALYVDDENQFVIRRMPNGSQKQYHGKVYIEIPAIGRHSAYRTVRGDV